MVVGRSGEVHHLQSEIDHEEGILLFNTIRDDLSTVKTLEVGCGFGSSSLHICKALQSRTRASHTIIDPFQTDWDSVGVKHFLAVPERLLIRFVLFGCRLPLQSRSLNQYPSALSREKRLFWFEREQREQSVP